MNATFTLYNGSNVIKTCVFNNKTNGTTLNCGMSNTSLWVKGNTINCTVTATDNNSQRSTGSATKNVSNLAPEITTEQTTVNRNNSQAYTYDYNASDPDEVDGVDTLTWSDNTTLFDINTSTGEITDTPTEAEAGTYSILITVSDGTAQDTDTFTYSITDATKPRVSINTPTASTYTLTNNITLNTTVTDPNRDKCWYSTNNFTTIISYDCSEAVIYNLSDGSYTLRVGANDTYGNINNTESVTFTVDLLAPNITLINPIDNASFQANNSVPFNCRIVDASACIVRFYWDYCGNWTLNGTSNVSAGSGIASFTRTPTAEGNYTWNCWANDTYGRESWGDSNYTFTVVTTTTVTTTTSSTTTTQKKSRGSGGGSRSGGVSYQKGESCFDGLRNQNETGVDCGGPCKPCVSCSDGIQNQGEDGIDCGGPCEPCETKTTTTTSSTTTSTSTTTTTKEKVTTTTRATTTTRLKETTTTTQSTGTVPLGVTTLAVAIILLFGLFLVLLKRYR